MTKKSDSQLIAEANVIRNETVAGANTEGRIADMIQDLIDSKPSILGSGVVAIIGDYDASVNIFPTTGGTGTGSAILKGNCWRVTVAGVLGGTNVFPGMKLIAWIDTPGQTLANWNIDQG